MNIQLMKKMMMGFIFIDSFVNEVKFDTKLRFENQLCDAKLSNVTLTIQIEGRSLV